MSAERVGSGDKGEVVEVTMPNSVDERILDQCAQVVELADQPAAGLYPSSMGRHGRIQVRFVHQAVEVDDELGRRIHLACNQASLYEARKPRPAVATVDLNDAVSRSQTLFVNDRLHRALCMGERRRRFDGALLVDGWRPSRSKLDQCAVPTHVQLERPPRIGIGRIEGWEGVRTWHNTQIEDQVDPVGATGTAPVVSGHDGATLPTAAAPAGAPAGCPSTTTGGE